MMILIIGCLHFSYFTFSPHPFSFSCGRLIPAWAHRTIHSHRGALWQYFQPCCDSRSLFSSLRSFLPFPYFLQSTGGKHKAHGPNLALHLVLSSPAPCFYPVAAPSSLPLVKEYLHLCSPKITFGPLKATARLMWPWVKMSLTPLHKTAPYILLYFLSLCFSISFLFTHCPLISIIPLSSLSVSIF